MKYIDLYNYLRDHEELNRTQAIRSIIAVRKLDPEIKKALVKWAETGKCDLTIEDVSFHELVTSEGMKPIRAFKMLDWLKREPVLAHRYLAQRVMLADLSKAGSAQISDVVPENDDEDKTDIIL